MQHDTVKVSLPYGKGRLEMELDSARCRFIGAYGVAAPEEGLADTGAAVAEALASPIGSPRLREIARGCTDLVIISDDATRLTPVSLILPGVLEELRAAGVDEDAVTVVMANGTHRPMTQEEIEAKLGTDLARRLRVENHDYRADDLVDMGSTPSGVPVMMNRTVSEADLVIGIGSIVPHRYCGWSGGAKIVQPGVCGEATTVATHLMITLDPGVRLGNVENVVRHEMEAVAERAGLRFIVNTVVSARGDVVSVVAGDPVKAHRAGVRLAEKVCSVRIPELADVVVASSFPADINFWQAGKSLYTADLAVRDGGAIVLVTPALEGIGEHPEFGPLIGQSRNSILKMLEDGRVSDRLGAAAALAVRLVADRASIILVTDGLTDDDTQVMGFERFDSGRLQQAFDRALEIARATGAQRPAATVLSEAPDTLPIIEQS
ncbi:MAG: nickel-dependent lactate racemase [Bacillota bacterium]|nr:nickel-dependent lactate racemase [Bacillota bacterium]